MPEYLFIYDHDLLNGKEDTNYDPMDAILYFHPSTTSVEIQLPLCSHVMGFCQILSNVFQSSPKLFTLESGAMVYCIHEPDIGLVNKSENRTITFALYSDDITNSNIKERCCYLYEAFVCYTKKCLSCTFKKGSNKQSRYITNLITHLMRLLNRRDQLSLVFNSSFFCDPNNDNFKSMDSLFYQSIVNIMDSIHNEAKLFNTIVLGGCLFFKKNLIMSQFPGSFSNILSIFIDCLNEDTGKSSKEIFSTVKRILVDTEDLQTRNGVHIFNVCLTGERYKELMSLSNEQNYSTSKGCCPTNGYHNVNIYIENHSNMTIIFLVEEPDSSTISKEKLLMFSNLCFNQLNNVANISNNISMTSTSTRKCSVGQGNIWNIVFDQTDQSLSVTNSSQSQNIATDWEECLVKRITVLHNVLQKEESIKEVQVKLTNESLSAVRIGSEEIYTVKSSN